MEFVFFFPFFSNNKSFIVVLYTVASRSLEDPDARTLFVSNVSHLSLSLSLLMNFGKFQWENSKSNLSK